ncbi:tetratricopeptide repeat protein [Methanosarcina vacuolata]|uniref:AAA+ ATPase domain-containing protein n=1 Tax=Methanosarcina vacuolata Z-761 TaxID=1434123 RepID=A0A0E3Q3M1_9EURY|nr:tetratricopeptide repeat protein [Methanosarcina vacuolata]AKB43958.1 hypothetical protein MSVAZ_1689 [Methanosarcina vacuolata Z-761]
MIERINIRTPDQRVRVFISSTITELKEEREAIKNAIIDLKLHPVFFEVGARPDNPQEVYRAYLEQSHIYVGIFWKSYGWISPKMTISGLEDEFNLSSQKKRLVYIKEATEGRDPNLEKLLQRIRNEGNICYKSFKTSEELVEIFKNDLMQLLSESFGLDTFQQQDRPVLQNNLDVLSKEMDKKPILKRENLINQIKEKLNQKKVLVLYGDPGSGKTYLLGLLGSELNAIYISLRNKTAQQVFSYIANHLSVRRNRNPESLPSENEAYATLQQELANNSELILIDDVDQNPIVAKLLLGLDLFNCSVVYATRSKEIKLFQQIPKFDVELFNYDEFRLFLEISNIKLPPGKLQELYTASQGNPLYLYYFTQKQVIPYPSDLAEYQSIIWQELSPLQQEIINFIVHSYSLLNTLDIHTLINSQQCVTSTIMETKKLIDLASPIINQTGQYYEIFHPYFKDYVLETADKNNISIHYHQILSEYAIKKQWILPTAFHLLRSNNPNVEKYLIEGSTAASLHGDWILAEEFLQCKIRYTLDNGDNYGEAHARYLLAQVYQEMGKYQYAKREADISLEIFVKLNESEWIEIIRIWSSLIFIEEGDVEKAISIHQNALEFYKGKDIFKEAFIQLNLGYAYIQVSRFREGFKASQRAFDLFTKLNDESGIYKSLVNLAGCVGELGDNELQKKYALEIIEIANTKNLPRLKAAGLNNLAVVKRREENPEAAQNVLEECIRICQKLGITESETINIINLGNALRDQHKYDDAERAYNEALIKAKENGFLNQEARALMLLSRIKQLKGFNEEAIKFGKDALNIYYKIGDYLQIGSALNYMARSYTDLGDYLEAAKSNENSGIHYGKAGQWDDAVSNFDQAASLWNSLAQFDRAFYCVSQSLKCNFLSESDNCETEYFIESFPDEYDKVSEEEYLNLLQLFLKQGTLLSFTCFMYNYLAYCKRTKYRNGTNYLKSALSLFISELKETSSSNILNSLAISIEQSCDELLSVYELEELAKNISHKIDHLHYRSHHDGKKIWTIGLDWKQPIIVQIICLSDDSIVQRLAMSLSLILISNKDHIQKTILEFGEIKEKGFSLQMITRSDAVQNCNMEVSLSEGFPASATGSNVPWGQQQPPTFLIIHDDYESITDWSEHPKNKAFVWVLMTMHSSLVSHCIHQNRDMSDLAKKSRIFCEKVLL